MAFRPQWYQNDQQRRGGFGGPGGVRDWTAMRLILTATLGVFALQFVLRETTRTDPLSAFLGLRSFWPGDVPGEPGGFNLFFPFQLFTYMLVHGSLMHVLGNMFFLYIFGRELEGVLGKAGLARLYLAGGVMGGLAMWVVGLLGGSSMPTVGASGAVYAVMVLYALRWPKRTILLIFPFPMPVPVILLVGFKIAGDLLGALQGGVGIAYLAHLGGAAIGYLWFRRGDVIGQVQQKVVQKRTESARASEAEDRREMDRILRKIQAEGLGSLSTGERGFLDRRSRELKQRGR